MYTQNRIYIGLKIIFFTYNIYTFIYITYLELLVIRYSIHLELANK